MDRVLDLLDVAAKEYPLKALADELGKGESTLRNELTEQHGYKLGLRTALAILYRTRDLRALDAIEAMLGRVAFETPKIDRTKSLPVLRLLGRALQEMGELTKSLAGAVAGGRMTRAEAQACLTEIDDAISALIQLKANLEEIL